MSTMHPQLQKQRVTITPELYRKLTSTPTTSFAPFYWKPPQNQSVQQRNQPVRTSRNDWGWSDKNYVRLPIVNTLFHSWDKIKESLLNLKKLAELWVERDLKKLPNPPNHFDWFEGIIGGYNDKAKKECNFRILKRDKDLYKRVFYALPGIIDQALKLPCRLEGAVPVLKQRENKTLYFTREAVCSLIANAFLCTFPEGGGGRDLPYFNFWSLFNESEWEDTDYNEPAAQVKREKLKCFLAYFEQMSATPCGYQNSIISYERRFKSRKTFWPLENKLLCPVTVCSNEKLEFCKGMLQVDFANRKVGGGVLNDGAVQEEIRFCVSPELIVARLFTEPLGHDEVLVVTGTEMFSRYTGYRDTFKWAEIGSRSSGGVDGLGREFTQVVAMDALFFKPNEKTSQYQSGKIDRELHKCSIAFTQGRHSTPVATGNWGCGAFNGDPQLKFLIQWMAASACGRNGMKFHAWDTKQKQELEKFVEMVRKCNGTVAQAYGELMKYERACVRGRNTVKSLFQFLTE